MINGYFPCVPHTHFWVFDEKYRLLFNLSPIKESKEYKQDSRMNTTDTIITEKMRTHPNEGMKMLMDEYQERLYWHIRRLVVHEDDAEDMLQEVFIKIYQKFDSFKGESSLFSWIYRVATNEVLSFLRKKKEEILPLDKARLHAADSYFEYGDKEAVALQEAIHNLPPKQQTTFNLRYYDELSFKQIAEITETSESSAKANFCFAKQKIIERMKQLEV